MSVQDAIDQARTVFPGSIKVPKPGILKPGSNNAKLGFNIHKGKWRGKKLYSLTLEERSTCPTDCHHWTDCYGNHMPFAHRFNKKRLLSTIEADIKALTKRHKKGIVVRLHVLGDFYSVKYVEFWGRMLKKYPTLCIFGYSARYTDNVIGPPIVKLNDTYPDRCVIRFSANITYLPFIRFQFAANEAFEGDSFTCPEQTNKVASCAKCALCWTTTKTVKFLTH